MSVPKSERTDDELWVCHLGAVAYLEGIAIQEQIRDARAAGELPDTLLLLEHPPVYTRGRRSAEGELPLGEDFYRSRGIEVIPTDRGGRITYHGPGQLVGYPIMRIDAIDRYLRTMEAAIVAALAEEQIEARARGEEGPDYTGVWVAERKIASIGVHVARGISTHGFAINVDNDLEPFSWIVACGLPDVIMTSIAEEHRGARPVGVDRFREAIAQSFCRAHGRRQVLASPRRLGVDAPAAPTRPGPRSSTPAARGQAILT